MNADPLLQLTPYQYILMRGARLFTHLHTHSYYSFLRGVPSPGALVDAASDQGMAALALTDRNSLTGAIEFYQACQVAGIHPILGLELAVAPPPDLAAPTGDLVLLALDLPGWASLCRLSSAQLTHPELIKSGEIPFEILAENTTGLLCLSGGTSGPAAHLVTQEQTELAERFVAQLAELFPERLYVELHLQTPDDRALAEGLARLATRRGLPLVAAQNVHSLLPDQEPRQRLLTAIRLNCSLAEVPLNESSSPGSHFASLTEMNSKFADYPAALASTQEIAARCQLELPLNVRHFPAIDLPEGETPEQVLRREAENGAQTRYGVLTPAIRTRLDHELQVIGDRDYAPLFLIMQEIVSFARSASVPVASRGSASSSLVAHCLGITTPDPLRENLYFERFLNPARASPPDFDLDLCSKRRDTVIRHVYEKYGVERVAMVATINRFRARSALREVGKAYGLSAGQIKTLVDGLPRRSWGPLGRAGGSASALQSLAGNHTDATSRTVIANATAILDTPRHLSIHPGGVVIAPGPLTDIAPTQLASKGVVITQFDLASVETLGLVKIDLLGIRGLSVLGDVAEHIQYGRRSEFATTLDVLDAIPPDDPATSKLVRSGRTIGCFQIESPGMRCTLREIQSTSIDDITMALALYRPGPLTGGLKDAFVRRHLGREPVTHLHPALAGLLAETHGVILYQEDVLRLAHELAGLSLADADLLRRAMGHFDPGREMQTLQERFVAGAQAQSGVPEQTGTRIWELMAAFAGYGFPKAHAVSYAQVAWRAAWCKAHYPAEFMAAVLANWGGYYRQGVYLSEARRLGLTLRRPHVNHSQRHFSVAYLDGGPELYMGMAQVRELTRRTQKRILSERPFGSFADFLARVDPRPKEAVNLVRCGACASMGEQPTLLRQLEQGGWQGGQLPLFAPDGDEAEAWSLEKRVAEEESILGVSVSAHPLELVAEQIDAAVLSTVEAAGYLGEHVQVAGVRQTLQRVRQSASGDEGAPSYRMELEDMEGTLVVIVPAHIYQRNRKALQERRPCVVEGVVEMDDTLVDTILRAARIVLI